MQLFIQKILTIYTEPDMRLGTGDPAEVEKSDPPLMGSTP